MDRKEKIDKSAPSVSPYEMQKGTAVWKIMDNAINDLVENKDLLEKTRRDYIVGYICNKLQSILPVSDD
jgi:hypothetical protein